MKEQKKYNGYCNWETWEFNLIINNEYRFYYHVKDFVINNLNDKETIIGCFRSFASSTSLNIDYHNIDFNEIADVWIDDIKEEVKQVTN